MKKPLILLTNDDGYQAEGIKILKNELIKDFRVVVSAPKEVMSACSHAITLRTILKVKKIEKDVFAVAGTPADCVNVALDELMDEKPFLIISGINNGLNLAQHSFYSGTVAGSREAVLNKIQSFAISVPWQIDNYQFAGKFANLLAAKLLNEKLPEHTLLNVNVPGELQDLKKYKVTGMGQNIHRKPVIRRDHPRGGDDYFWQGGFDTGLADCVDSDCQVVKDGYVSITPQKIDLTDTSFLSDCKKWGL